MAVNNTIQELSSYAVKLTHRTNLTNVVFVNSAIQIENIPLQHTAIRSVFNKDERLAQILVTIASIRKYIPDSYVVLIDTSHSRLNDPDRELIFAAVDSYYDFSSHALLVKYSKNGDKAFGLILGQYLTLSHLLSKDFKFDRIIGIIGRTELTENFNYKELSTPDKFVYRYKKFSDYGEVYHWTAYSIPYTERQLYLYALFMIYMYRSHNMVVDIEHCIVDLIPVDKVLRIEYLGLQGTGADGNKYTE